MKLNQSTKGAARWCMSVFFATMVEVFSSFGVELGEFLWRNPLPHGNLMNGVAYGAGRFVAVGGPGTIMTSSNGLNWRMIVSPSNDYLQGIAYGNGLFVANGPQDILVSTNHGSNWTVVRAPVTNALNNINFVNGQFMLGTYRGPILTSSNGRDWVGIPLPVELSETSPWSFTYGNGLYMAAGSGVITSPDGMQWSRTEDAGRSIIPPLYGVAFGDGQFVAVGYSGRIYVSKDGDSWKDRSLPPWTTYALSSVIYENGCFFAVGYGAIRKSVDGEEWSDPILIPDSTMHLNSLAHADGRWVGVGTSGGDDGGEVWVSTNTLNWTPAIIGDRSDLYDIAVGGGMLVAVGGAGEVGYNGPGRILNSQDGITWTHHEIQELTGLGAVAYGNQQFVAVSGIDGSKICISSNGIDWRVVDSGNHNRLYDIVWGNGLFVAVGTIRLLDSTPISVSSNGLDWIAVPSEVSAPAISIAYGNGAFIAGGFGYTLFSPDGFHWTVHDSEVTKRFFDFNQVVFANGEFFATGRYSPVPGEPERYGLLRSQDGTNWMEISGLNTAPTSLSFGNGQFLGVNRWGAILSSTNGIDWNELSQTTQYGLTGCLYHDGKFYVIGTAGRILDASIKPSLDISWSNPAAFPVLGLSGVSGKSYLIQSIASLTTGTPWTDFTNLTLHGTRQVVVDGSTSNATVRFYRAISAP